jgi:hypothetical protein
VGAAVLPPLSETHLAHAGHGNNRA